MKTFNDYAAELGAMYSEIPKAVLAAVAISSLTCGGDYLEHAKQRVADEWRALYDAGIVPQKPIGEAGRIAQSVDERLRAEDAES
jgi:hypothetical protein